MRAIIVEDEFLAAIHAEAVLESCGVEVIGMAEDMEGALALTNGQPNIALVDLNLRDGFTGPAIGSSLKKAGIEIVFVTANPSQLEGCNEFASAVIEKPIDERLLVDTIERIKQQAQPRPSAV